MNDSFAGAIDLFLDGLLDGEGAPVLFKNGAPTEATRMAIEIQRTVDAALARLFSPPPVERVLSELFATSTAAPQSIRIGSRLRGAGRRLAIAAVLAMGVLGGWRIWSFLNPPQATGSYAVQPWRSVETIYQDAIAAKLKPDWVCRNDQEFGGFFRQATGTRLLLAEAPVGTETYGLSRCNCFTPQTIYLLGRVDNQPVLVFAHRASQATKASLPRDSSRLRLFERRIGTAVLHELTPLESPRLLDLFYIPGEDSQQPPSDGPSRWEKDSAPQNQPPPPP